MTAPTFKKATDTAAGDATKYGAPDVKYAFDVLDGTHSTDRVQIQNIERAALPHHFYIYKEGATTYARRGDTGAVTYSGSDSKTVVQSALDGAYTEFTRAVIAFAPQSFDFATQSLTIGVKSAVVLRGAGMGQTIISNGAITKGSSTATDSVAIEDMTINSNSSLANAVSFSSNSAAFVLRRVKLTNSGTNTLFNWTDCDTLLVDDCIFVDGGIATASDNAVGNQTVSANKASTFTRCYFEKTSSATAGAVSLLGTSAGGTGNLIITNCHFMNSGTASTSDSAISVRNTSGTCKSIVIANCFAYGPNMGITVGTGTTNFIDRALISGCITELGGHIAVTKAKEAIIANCMAIAPRTKGFGLTSCTVGKIANCFAKNTNQSAGSPTTDKGGLYTKDNTQLEVDRVTVIDDQGTGTTPYGGYFTQTSSGTNISKLSECNFTGPFITSALTSENTLHFVIRGGEVSAAPALTNTNNYIFELRGYNPQGAATITPGASPYTYTNTDGVPEMVHIFGGTVSNVSRDGTQIASSTNVHTWLTPGQAVVVTYSSVPTMRKDRK